jgi:serine/threonine protein kinase
MTSSELHDDGTPIGFPDRLDELLTVIQQGNVAEIQRLTNEDPALITWKDCFRELNDFADLVSNVAAPGNIGGETIQFGQYELRGELGRGGVGVVYHAYQKALDRHVALKMLTGSAFSTSEQRRRFVQEARLIARIRHPHIVSVHDVGELGGQPFYTMELIEGESLASKLGRGRMEVRQAIDLMLPITQAVEYLHQQGVLHRDLKPSNILLDVAGEPCLVDFGLSRAMDEFHDPTVTGTILGTPSYMPPEQAAGRVREIDVRSDVYSLGAILYEMICGRPPFVANSALDTVLQVLERDPLPLRHWNRSVPRDVEHICLRCLEKSPDLRYLSAREFATDLERCQRGERPAAQLHTLSVKVSRLTRRYPSATYRLLGLLPTLLIVLLRCAAEPIFWGFYLPTLVGLCAWAILSFSWECCARQTAAQRWAPFAFVITDIVILTAILHFVQAADGPFIAAYVLLVLMAGLSLDRRLVWTSGISSVVGYFFLVMWSGPLLYWHIPIIVAILLMCCTAVTDYQVHRLSVLIRPRDRFVAMT